MLEFDQLDCGNVGGVSWCVIMLIEYQLVYLDHTAWISKNGSHHIFGWMDSPYLLWSRFTVWNPLFRLFCDLCCAPVDPCFVEGLKMKLKVQWIALQTFQWRFALICLYGMIKRKTNRAPTAFSAKYFMPNVMHVLFWDVYCLNLQSAVLQYKYNSANFCQVLPFAW